MSLNFWCRNWQCLETTNEMKKFSEIQAVNLLSDTLKSAMEIEKNPSYIHSQYLMPAAVSSISSPSFLLPDIFYNKMEKSNRIDYRFLYRLYCVGRKWWMAQSCRLQWRTKEVSTCRGNPPRFGTFFIFLSHTGYIILHTSADPTSGAFLTPGSGIQYPGWVKNQDPDPGCLSKSLETIFSG